MRGVAQGLAGHIRSMIVSVVVDRFGDVLNAGQCEELLDNLKRTRSWHCCAHGRPTVAPLVDVPALQRVIALRGFAA